jgi:hypothetical protein
VEAAVEFVTVFDQHRVGPETAEHSVRRRAELIAMGDFRDPDDANLDDVSAREAARARVIGRG